jgi:hypothetical protein
LYVKASLSPNGRNPLGEADQCPGLMIGFPFWWCGVDELLIGYRECSASSRFCGWLGHGLGVHVLLLKRDHVQPRFEERQLKAQASCIALLQSDNWDLSGRLLRTLLARPCQFLVGPGKHAWRRSHTDKNVHKTRAWSSRASDQCIFSLENNFTDGEPGRDVVQALLDINFLSSDVLLCRVCTGVRTNWASTRIPLTVMTGM